ncbi:hypothetical protein A2Z23_01895 [Candidatus Curtissbacteria bacterium RBG_16_39_7]|uniref:Uncharacterized protein n=1 Tax=Candidatus Curtissbacteria bacterium RBG_16_39_7 TaxID=1797707 RepID=A0A1F5G4C0_9BACT|nr:MAG: hypothetical protein A2Z23_01895 [Candidatus Curtissbacteria bacterium RBG_16_39_7]
MEQSETQATSFVEIEAKPFLEKGQNFFDQEPFKVTVGQVARQTSLTEERIRHLIHFFANSMGREDEKFKKELKMKTRYTGGEIEKRHLIQLISKTLPGREKNQEALTLAVTQLDQFPLWDEYVRTQKDHYYSPDGTFLAQYEHTWFPQETYASWVTKLQKRRHALKAVGIEEVFPEKAPVRGKRSNNRRWKILRAAELVPKRR